MWLGILFFSCLLVAFVAVVTTSDMGIKGIMQGSPHKNRRVQRQKKRRLSPKEGRIVGGAPTGAGTYPFMVALYDTESLDSGALPICGKCKDERRADFDARTVHLISHVYPCPIMQVVV